MSAAAVYQERGQFRQGAGESLGHPNARVRPVLTRMCSVAQSSPTLWDPMDCSLPGSSVHGDFPGKNSGVGCHALLQGIFTTQGLNPGLPHCRQILYHLSHQGSPLTRILTPCSQVPSLQKGGHQSHSRTSSPSCNYRHRRGTTPLTESDQTQRAEAISEVVCALSEAPGRSSQPLALLLQSTRATGGALVPLATQTLSLGRGAAWNHSPIPMTSHSPSTKSSSAQNLWDLCHFLSANVLSCIHPSLPT